MRQDPTSCIRNSETTQTLLSCAIACIASGIVWCSVPLEASVPRQNRQLHETIGARLNTIATLRARFTHEKRIKVMTRPLISRGRLLFVRGRGLYWQTDSPFHSQLVFSKRGVRRLGSAGGSQTGPLIKALARIFVSVISADINSLRSRFKVTASGDAKRWSLVLLPISTREVTVQRIVLRGQLTVEVVTIHERNGDTSSYRLSEITTRPTTLSADEKKLLR